MEVQEDRYGRDTYVVYKHTSPSGKVYIGITRQNPRVRWGNGNNYSSNRHFSQAIKKYGWKNFRHEILFSCLSEQDAKNEEIRQIALYDSTNPNNGYNITYGGESGSGYHHSDEARSKISKAMRGRVSPMRGRPHSADSKAKISASNKNKVRRKGFHLSEETKSKISEANKGIPRPKSKEHAKKLAEQRRGTVLSEETKKKMSKSRLLWCLKNGEKILQISQDGIVLKRWNNQSEAIRELGVRQTTFSLHVLNGKPLGGFIYIKEKDFKDKSICCV